MAKRTPSSLCNVAMVGHGGAGKTTFVDHLLHAVGFAQRAGDVDAGSSLSDYDPEEKERQFSIHSTLFHFEAEGRHFNLIDCPGYLDLIGPAMGALPVVETALITVNARDGVLLNTRRMWGVAEGLGLARVILITNLDGENIEFEALLSEIQDSLGKQCRAAFLPVGLGHACTGVVNLLTAKEAPDGVVGDFEGSREGLMESIIESDDALMERYLEGEQIGRDELLATVRKAVAAGTLVPVMCCAAKADLGVREAASFLAACAPSPHEGPVRTAMSDDEEVELRPEPDAPFCARLFKAVTDVHVGKVAYFRVYSGSLGGDLSVRVARTGKRERLGHVYLMKGHQQEEVAEAVPGDILCVTKMAELQLNDTLSAPGVHLEMAPMEFPEPMMSLAVEAASRDDDQKVAAGLLSLAEGDPTLRVGRDEQSHELVITGMSTLHLEVMLGKLKRRTGISVQTHEPSVPYRETISTKAEAKYRHKKQTGGRGQYGEVYLRVEPNERGAGFEFLDEVVGGAIPRQFIPAVEKGIREVIAGGVLAGYPVVDVKAAVFDGSHHSVDSSEAAFKIAGARAFREAFMAARAVLLEPIARMEVTIPARFMGDVSGNLSSHRARIQGMEQVRGMQVLKAEIPMAEVARYGTELKSITSGEGSFTLELSHYEPVPAHVQQEIVSRRQTANKED